MKRAWIWVGVFLLAGPVQAAGPRAAGASVIAFGAVCDGRTDDTAALQAALDRTGIVRLPQGRPCRISHRLRLASGAVITSERGAGTIVLGSRPGEFGVAADAKLTGAVDFGLYVNQASNVSLRNFAIRMERRDATYVHAIAVMSSSDVAIQGLDISGLAGGYGILVRSSHHVTITGNHLHGFLLNAAPSCGLEPPARIPASSPSPPGVCGKVIGIKVDSGQRSFAESYAISIVGNRLDDLDVGPEFNALWGFQSEGINVAGPQDSDATPLSQLSHDIVVADNVLTRMGIGINSYGSKVRIERNTISDVASYGVKLTHGATADLVAGNTISRAGSAGIYLRGYPPGRSTTANSITGNLIRDVGRGGFGRGGRGDQAAGAFAVYCVLAPGNILGPNRTSGERNFAKDC